jgi:hypothetical protein
VLSTWIDMFGYDLPEDTAARYPHSRERGPGRGRPRTPRPVPVSGQRPTAVGRGGRRGAAGRGNPGSARLAA